MMHRYRRGALVLGLLALPGLTFGARIQAQTQGGPTAQSVLRTACEMQKARFSTVTNYSMAVSMTGIETPEYQERMSEGPCATFRVVPMTEWTERGGMSDEELKAMTKGMAQGYRMLAGAARSGQMGTAPGPLGAMMNAHMAGMLDSAAMFMEFTSAAVDSISDGRAEAREGLQGAALFAARARLVGREQVHGRDAYLLRAEGLADLPIEQADSAPPFFLDVANVWFDATEHVQLRLKMEGRMVADGRTTPVTIELDELDYRPVGPLYISHRQVMRMTGLMDGLAMDPRRQKEMEKNRKDMEKAKVELEKLKRQLEQMPAAQRRMVQGHVDRMEAQMKAFSGGAIEVELTRRVLGVNEGPPRNWKPRVR